MVPFLLLLFKKKYVPFSTREIDNNDNVQILKVWRKSGRMSMIMAVTNVKMVNNNRK